MLLGHIAEDEHGPDDGAGRVVDGRATVGDLALGAVAGDERGMVDQADDAVLAQGAAGWDFGRLPGLGVDDAEDLGDGPAPGLVGAPSGERLGHGV